MANRYTQLTASEYKPLSMQEMMIAPATLRQKHDEALAKQQELALGLNAYGNPLSQHFNRTKQIQNELNSVIDQQAESLAKNGYTRDSGADMIRLNRQYQNLISPTGELGQINAAKEAYFKNREEFMKSSDAQKYGRDVAERRWAEHAARYTGYDANGNIVQIGTMGAPENRTEMDAAQEARKLVGSIKKEIAAGGGRVVARDDGSYAVINGKGSLLQSSNMDQLNSLLQAAKYEFSTPGQRGYESAKFRGSTPQQSLALLESYFNGMLETENRDTRSSSISLSGVKNWRDAEQERMFGANTGGVIQNALGREYENINTFNTARNQLLSKQSSKEGLTSDERDQLRSYNNQLKLMKDNLKDNSLYNQYAKQVEKANEDVGLDANFKREDLQVREKMGTSWGRVVPVESTYYYKGNKISRSEYDKMIKKANEASGKARTALTKMNEIESSYLNKSNQIQMTMLETTEKSEKTARAVERNLHLALTDKNILTNNKNIEVQSIQSSSEKESKNIGNSRKEEFGKDFYSLMSSVSPDDVTARQIGFGPDGAYLKVSVKTNGKGDKYKVSGQTVKPGETLDVIFKIKSTDGNYGISNPFASAIRLHTNGNMAALNTSLGGDGLTQNYNIGEDVRESMTNQNLSNQRWGVPGVSDLSAITNNMNLRNIIVNTAQELGLNEPRNIEELQTVLEYLKQNEIKVGK